MTYSESSIVRILRKQADSSYAIVGAGFLVSEKHILTCAHVVTQALQIPTFTTERPTETIWLDFPHAASGQKFATHVICWRAVVSDKFNSSEEGQDISVLELDSSPPNDTKPVSLLRLEDDNTLWNHNIRAFGFPIGHNNGEWAVGELRGRRIDGTIQIVDKAVPGPRIQEGFSGTPVWDQELKGIVGMIVEADTNANAKTSFMIPTSLLMKAWQNLIDYIAGATPTDLIASFDYSCYISYPIVRANIVKEYISELKDALYEEMNAFGLGNKKIYYDDWQRLRGEGFYGSELVKKLCKSVCMLVVFTPAYFNCIDCTLEYKAMERLEQERFKLLGISVTKTERLIIPVVARGSSRFPAELTSFDESLINNFENYLPGRQYFRRTIKVASRIRQIAEHVFDYCEQFQARPEALNACENFTHPTAEEIRDWHQMVRSSSQGFPLR